MLDGLGDLVKQYGGFWMSRTVPHNYVSYEIEKQECAFIFFTKCTQNIYHISICGTDQITCANPSNMSSVLYIFIFMAH